MLDKDKIIANAFVNVSELFGLVNDVRAELSAQAAILLDEVVVNIGADAKFLFNARTVILNKADSRERLVGPDEYRFNIPNSFLGIIWASHPYYVEGKYVVSQAEEIEATFLHSVGLMDYPQYMSEYLSLCLAEKYCQQWSTYADYLEDIRRRKASEAMRIMTSERMFIPNNPSLKG